jgi:hypothetical protein
MEPKERERLADQWLDAALKRYGEAEPRPGLEGRVLVNLQSADAAPLQRWRWRTALAAVAILVGGAAVLIRNHTASAPEVVIRQPQTPPSIAAAPVVASAPEATGRPAARRQTVQTQAEPRLPQFPSPQPLNAEEKALARYIADRPAEARQMAQAQTELMQEEAREFEEQTAGPSQDSSQ